MDDFINLYRNTNQKTPTCPECQVGQMKQRSVTYFTWLMDELITVPDFPAWVCDVCGRRAYDSKAITQLSTLLNPTAGKPAAKKHRIPTRVEKKRGSAGEARS